MPDEAAPDATPSGPGRRVTVRYPLPADITCPLTGDAWQGPQRATVRDVSRGGIGLLLDAPVALGARMLIELHGEGSRPLRRLACRVVHVTERGGGAWVVGCAFDAPLSASEREAVLGGDAPRDERRPHSPPFPHHSP
jgi:hypothetical protein